MSTKFEIIAKADLVWRDNQPYSQDFNDVYFSIDDGFLETKHVFINGNNLLPRWTALHNEANARFVIAETGFGTGLNFLITWYFWQQYAPPDLTLYYYSCEKFPLSVADLQLCLALWPQLDSLAGQLIANYPILTPGFHALSFQDGRINLILMLYDVCQSYKQLLVCGDNTIERASRTFTIDAWFLDGFAPSKNEDMWSEEFFEIMGLLSSDNTSAATYSAAGIVKERLLKNGFAVERVAGFGSKKHMLVAEFEKNYSIKQWRYCRYRLTPWHIAPRQIESSSAKRAIVVGGGLAGCFTAHALAKRGWHVTIIEAKNQVGLGASGNRGAVLYPQFSAFRSPLTEFMLMAFLYAVRFYRPLLNSAIEGELNGMLQFAATHREVVAHANLQIWLNAYPELGRLVTDLDASSLAGLKLQKGGLFIPDAGWINSQSLCHYLISHDLITVKTLTVVDVLHYEDNVWQVGKEAAEIVIIANGHAASAFKQTNWLPIKPVAGQMTFIKANKHSKPLKIPLCGNAHFLPVRQNMHALGATFHLKMDNFTASSHDDLLNLKHLHELPFDSDFKPEVVASWGGVRAAAPDYLPLVGPVAIPDSFYAVYAALAKDSRRFISAQASHYPGLYLGTGFGSRGLATIPLCCEWLAAHINQEPNFMPRSLLQAISPSRFLRQKIVRLNDHGDCIEMQSP